MPVTENSPLLPSTTAHSQQLPWYRNFDKRLVLPLSIVVLLVGGLLLLLLPTHCHSNDVAAVNTSAPTTEDRHVHSTETSSITAQEPSADVDAVLHMLPPYQARLHPLPPKLINRTQFAKAIPTNAFWTNLLVGDDHGLNSGAGQITLSPYTIRAVPKRLEISYGDTRRVVTNTSITEYFNVDFSLTAYAHKPSSNATRLLGDGNSTAREVVAFDPLSATLRYSFGEKAEDKRMDALLVRGASYMTVLYRNVMPVVELNGTLLRVNGEGIDMQKQQQWTSDRFEVDVEVYSAGAVSKGTGKASQKWILYFAEPRSLQLQDANERDYRPYNLRGELTTPTNFRLVDTALYTGPARVAIVPSTTEYEGEFMQLLDTHASVYPIGSSIETEVNGLNATIKFCWKTARFSNNTNYKTSLLMMANPHHVATFANDHPDFTVLKSYGHRTLKSKMTAMAGDCWSMNERLTSVGFDTTNVIAHQYVNAIQTALIHDANYTPEAKDPYFFGKEIARQARLVLIADRLKNSTARDDMLDQLQGWIAPWLTGANEDHFIYEQSWGGLCSKNGLKGVFWMTDFGNGWYNDHHFHYGYFIYSLAVVAKYRPSFVNKHRGAILSIVRDIASPHVDDVYFPLTRHFSWFDGHSFASGVYTLDGGKSQESVSEAINAYYGVYLLGKAMAIPEIQDIGHVLLALEMRAAQTYWQMPSSSGIYEPLYAQNKMTGQVACTKVSYTTWFGPQVEHMHLINMIPFTPITSEFISRQYVTEEFPVLVHEAFERPADPIDARWKGYAYLDMAMIEPATAWKHVTQDLDFFDDGNSKTNSLYWIATQA